MEWHSTHKHHCECNYEGSSPAMEMQAAENIWRRSESYGLRYATTVSDGDAKSLAHLNELKVYGEQELEKIECLNHVAKRLGTALRNVVRVNRGTETPLGGKYHGSLKDSTINKLTAYYRNAIQNNLQDNIEDMKKAIYATLYHCSSTDEKPKHTKCPNCKESWCFFFFSELSQIMRNLCLTLK